MEIEINRKILDANDGDADENRRVFREKQVFVLNVMSAPGSGKTALLVKTIKQLQPDISCAVIVGDISTTNDAVRLAETGVDVIQINTDAFGGDCHLSARRIAEAAGTLPLDSVDLLIVENIGNLVCPAEFDIGEDTRAVVISVTEGEDKPLKYPLMFRVCDATLYNKTDLLPHLDYDMAKAVSNISHIHPGMPIFPVSARTGEGFEPWMEWLIEKVREKQLAMNITKQSAEAH
jgi:hydrogenase nickel incorporation protein HypB